MTQYLVEFGGADVNVKDELGRTPSNVAKEMAHIDIMNYLDKK